MDALLDGQGGGGPIKSDELRRMCRESEAKHQELEAKRKKLAREAKRLRRAKQGGGLEGHEPPADWEKIFERLPAIENQFIRRGYRRQEVEDAVQDAALTVLRWLHSERDLIGKIDSFLRVCVYRALCATWRKRTVDLLGDDLPEPASEGDLGDQAARGELSQKLSAALNQFYSRASSNKILELREVHGLTYCEIGAQLGIPEQTVKSRLFTARKRLRGFASDLGFDPFSA